MTPHSHALIDVLKDWRLWPTLNQYQPDECEFVPLEQGLTNENWLITLPDETKQQFVIRINAKNAKVLNIHHQNEYEIVEGISQLNICPAITYKDANYKYWVRPYISGDTLAEYQNRGLSMTDKLQSVADTLKRAHCQPIQNHWPSVNTFVRTEFFWAQILPNPAMQKDGIEALKHKLDSALQPITHQVALCHMDTNLHNWIVDESGSLHLIDWEYAGLGNPIWDLAVFSDSAKLSQSDDSKLLEFYGKYTLDELELAKQQMEYLSILWFAIQENTHSNTLMCELNNLAIRVK